MNIADLKKDASIRGKNGMPFLMAATVIWIAITIIFLQPFEIYTKNIMLFISTGFLFPIALFVSKIMKADWQLKDNPLSMLGLIFNMAQFMYFPIIIWAFVQSPEQMVFFFAIIAGAHFFPYGWFYDTKVYYVMAPVIAVVIMIIGWDLDESILWLIPLVMTLSLLVMVLLLSYNLNRNNRKQQ